MVIVVHRAAKRPEFHWQIGYCICLFMYIILCYPKYGQLCCLNLRTFSVDKSCRWGSFHPGQVYMEVFQNACSWNCSTVALTDQCCALKTQHLPKLCNPQLCCWGWLNSDGSIMFHLYEVDVDVYRQKKSKYDFFQGWTLEGKSMRWLNFYGSILASNYTGLRNVFADLKWWYNQPFFSDV